MRMKIITNGGSRAHPRGCGEHEEGMPGVCLPGGSSPRVRGTCSTRNVERSSRGLIPAGAGNILVIATDPITRMGSSPRVRGTFRVIQNTNHHRGLIPAGAGNILSDMGFYPHTSSFSISLKPITYFQEYTICSYLRREARLYRLALLHPFRGTNPFFGVDGRIISLTPSKSTGSHG